MAIKIIILAVILIVTHLSAAFFGFAGGYWFPDLINNKTEGVLDTYLPPKSNYFI